MDILYIVGKGSKHDNYELRYSLRSICKYGSGIGKVIIAGCPPDWLSKEAVQVCCQDEFAYKHQNILRVIENVVDKGVVEGEFLYSSDDHFYVKPVDFGNYPYYLKSDDLRSGVERGDKFYKYHKSLVDTRNLLIKYSLPHKNFSQHCNTHMHSEIFKSIRPLVHDAYSLPYGAEPTTIVMNKWISLDGSLVTTRRKDSKILSATSVEELREKIGERECFSIGDAIFNGFSLPRMFQEEFPEKCVFEM